MNDLQVVNSIINDAVKNSSYITVLISSGVFIMYTIIIKLIEYFKAKDRNRPLLEMASAIREISENVVKLNQVLDKTIQDAEIKNTKQLEHIIPAAFDSAKSGVITHVINVILHNNITVNEAIIKQNLSKIVSTEYYKLYAIFSVYEHNTINVATIIKEEWIDNVTKECLSIIYNGSDAATRIRQLNDKLKLITEEYTIYMKNKVFNH